MKLEFNSVDEHFNQELTAKSKEMMIELIRTLEVKYIINLETSYHNYQIVRILLSIFTDCSELTNNIVDFTQTVINFYGEKYDESNMVIDKAFKKRDEANHFYWEYNEIAKLSIKEEITFRKSVEYRMSMIHKFIENIMKREMFLFYAMDSFINGIDIIENPNLNNLITVVFGSRVKFISMYNEKELFGISINQWRNIGAHSSYECNNNKIIVMYGNKKEELDIEDLDIVMTCLYGIRAYFKLTLNITLDILLTKYPKYLELIQYIPETALLDINSYLSTFGIRLCEWSLDASKDRKVCKLKYESTCRHWNLRNIIIFSLMDFSKVFNSDNYSFSREELDWEISVIEHGMESINIGIKSTDFLELIEQSDENVLEFINQKIR